jgi:hypothetical protein
LFTIRALLFAIITSSVRVDSVFAIHCSLLDSQEGSAHC